MATTRYPALLRGVNVGRSPVSMAELARALTADGLVDVTTYIQRGNVLVSSDVKKSTALESAIRSCIEGTFGLDVAVAVFSAAQWLAVIA